MHTCLSRTMCTLMVPMHMCLSCTPCTLILTMHTFPSFNLYTLMSTMHTFLSCTMCNVWKSYTLVFHALCVVYAQLSLRYALWRSVIFDTFAKNIIEWICLVFAECNCMTKYWNLGELNAPRLPLQVIRARGTLQNSLKFQKFRHRPNFVEFSGCL